MTGHTFSFRAATATTARTTAALGQGLPLALPVETMTNSRPTWCEPPKVQLRARTVLRHASRTSVLAAAGTAANLEPALTRCRNACKHEAPRSRSRWSGTRGRGPGHSISPRQAGAVSTLRGWGCAAEAWRGLSARMPSSLLLLSVLSIFRARTDEETPEAGGAR
jgi:hypothetical protein